MRGPSQAELLEALEQLAVELVLLAGAERLQLLLELEIEAALDEEVGEILEHLLNESLRKPTRQQRLLPCPSPPTGCSSPAPSRPRRIPPSTWLIDDR